MISWSSAAIILAGIAQQALNRFKPIVTSDTLSGLRLIRSLKEFTALADSPHKTAIGQLRNVKCVGVCWVFVHAPDMSRAEGPEKPSGALKIPYRFSSGALASTLEPSAKGLTQMLYLRAPVQCA